MKWASRHCAPLQRHSRSRRRNGATEAIYVKSLHAKIGELTLETIF
jgi:hypothetical protein